jgi:hypothetical protein
MDGGERRKAHEQTLRLLDMSITLDDVAMRIRAFLDGLGR